MIVLGIETSCDETAVAIVRSDKKILFHHVRSQMDDHVQYGGVVPEIAARAHLSALPGMLQQALADTNLQWQDISGIAATAGPGLIGGVMVGVMMAKAIAAAHGLPFMAVNHLAAHALTVRLCHDVGFPYLMLLVSGGHCQLITVKSPTDFECLGGTIDDAVGECLDKAARLLGLPYPGGPEIEKLALGGNGTAYNFPVPFKGRSQGDEAFQFSFSGLKSAVRRLVEQTSPLSQTQQQDIAASLQHAVAAALVDRSRNALKHLCALEVPLQGFVLAGGVAANLYLRSRLEHLTNEFGIPFMAPPPQLCTDNGAMIAWTGIEWLAKGFTQPLTFKPRPRWPLKEIGQNG